MAMNGDTSFEEIMRVVDYESDFNKDNEGIKKTILGAATEAKVENTGAKNTENSEPAKMGPETYIAPPRQEDFQIKNIETQSVKELMPTEEKKIDEKVIEASEPTITIATPTNKQENYDDLSYDDFDINNI
jgi:hypothetical protein